MSFPVLLTATVTLWTNKWWRWWWFSKLFHWHTRQLICKHGHPQAWGTCPPWKRQKWINVLFFVQKSYQTDRKRNLTSNVAILMWNWLWTVEKKEDTIVGEMCEGKWKSQFLANIWLNIGNDTATSCLAKIFRIWKSLKGRFLPRDALVHSAVLRLHVVRLSVCPSVCPSVCLWRWWIRIT